MDQKHPLGGDTGFSASDSIVDSTAWTSMDSDPGAFSAIPDTDASLLPDILEDWSGLTNSLDPMDAAGQPIFGHEEHLNIIPHLDSTDYFTGSDTHLGFDPSGLDQGSADDLDLGLQDPHDPMSELVPGHDAVQPFADPASSVADPHSPLADHVGTTSHEPSFGDF